MSEDLHSFLPSSLPAVGALNPPSRTETEATVALGPKRGTQDNGLNGLFWPGLSALILTN